LNCNEYDSAFVTNDAKLPAAGNADGFIHASTENAEAKFNDADDATDTVSSRPSNDTAVFPADAGKRLGCPNPGPFR
jgi:hypothetical protein